MKYQIQDREAGNRICEVETLKEAQKLVETYEKQDKQDNTYTPNFYEIIEL